MFNKKLSVSSENSQILIAAFCVMSGTHESDYRRTTRLAPADEPAI
jgi:hypothetical protein